MSEKTFSNVRIIHKHDTEENWLKAINFIPKQGELIIYDIDDTHAQPRFKIGDGETLVSELPFSQAQQPNWDQMDENAADYIQNRPFYGKESDFKWTPVLENAIVPPSSNSMFSCVFVNPFPNLAIGQTYKIVIDGKEYIDVAKLRQHSDGDTPYVGRELKESVLSSKPFLDIEGEFPFFITSMSEMGICCFVNHTQNIILNVYIQEPDIKLLDRMYIDYVPGEKTFGQKVTYQGKEYTSAFGAEIFNNYNDNKAVGDYSHAEGNINIALGKASHTEGYNNIAIGEYSHAEGAENLVNGTSSHVEGNQVTVNGSYAHGEGHQTQANGWGSHSEGYYSIADGNYSHAEGLGTKAATIANHTQGTYNIPDEIDETKVFYSSTAGYGDGNVLTYNIDYILQVPESEPQLNYKTGFYEFEGEIKQVEAKNLKENDVVVFKTENINGYYRILSTELSEDGTKITFNCSMHTVGTNSTMGKYITIIGNGSGGYSRSNAHTLDWDGNAWYSGDIYVGSTSGVNKDEGSKKVATEEFVLEQFNNVPEQAQPNWDENDQESASYVQNRPFYSTGEYETIELMNATVYYLGGDDLGTFYMIRDSAALAEGQKYQVILNSQQYLTTAQMSNDGYLILGNLNFANTDEWDEGDPFCFYNMGGIACMYTTSDLVINNIIINETIEIVKELDKKYIPYLAGTNVTNKKVTYNDKEYLCEEGAEIFNTGINLAIGPFSHAEGFSTVALESNTHAEGANTKALGMNSHAEGTNTEANGNQSHAEGGYTQAKGLGSHAEGNYSKALSYYTHAEGNHTIANSMSLHVQGMYNIPDDVPAYSRTWLIWTDYPKYDGDKVIYIFNDEPTFNANEGTSTIVTMPYEATIKDLKEKDYFLFEYPESEIIDTYYYASKLISQETNNETGKTMYKWNYSGATYSDNLDPGTYAHIVGNGDYVYDEDLKTHVEKRSNAHTLDWSGNAWFAGDVYVGSTSGTNRDEGSKKLATEDFVKNSFVNLNSNTVLSFYCVEDVTIVTNGISKVYPANSNVEVRFTEDDVFEIIPTSNNSIFALNAFPGALNTFYPWLEGVKQFSNILFDMNSEDMYTKWSQGNQGVYKVQFAQYINCIFWSDNPYISEVTKRTNYTLYNTSQIPLCYSNIPENTFKSFYLALGVVSDPNWANPLYRESFANASWATQAFSYYGARTIGLPGLDSSEFNIVLPKDCRGIMFDAEMVENAGVFDAVNVTNFGAKSGSWRDAFGNCTALRKLYIKNLKVNLDVSWSPIEYNSIYYIVSNAANTNKITISVSPYTYNLLSAADFELATEKNITIELLSTHYAEDKRLSDIANKADKEYVNEAVESVKDELLNGAGEAYDTLKELADLIDENTDAIDALESVATGKADATHTHTISEVIDLQNELDALAEHTADADIHFTAAERTQLAEIAEIISQAAYIDILDNETVTDANVSGSNVTVDSTLSETSENPVQNKIITNEINELNDKIDRMIELAGGDSITIPNYLSGQKVIMSSYIKISDTPIPREALVNGGSYVITYLNTSTNQTMPFADRGVQNYLECPAMFQFGGFITVIEDTDCYGEAVAAGLYADAFAYSPNTYISSLTINEYDGFTSEKIKESYLPSLENKVDIKQGKVNANHFVMTDENGDITASKLISDVFGFLTCSVTIDIDSNENAILYIDPAGDKEHISYQLKGKKSFNSPGDSPKDFDYYVFDFNEGYTSSVETIDAIRTIESCLNQGTFTNINVNIYDSNTATRSGGNGSYIVDAFEGISFGFGKTYVRITTNTAGQGSTEPE